MRVVRSEVRFIYFRWRTAHWCLSPKVGHSLSFYDESGYVDLPAVVHRWLLGKLKK